MRIALAAWLACAACGGSPRPVEPAAPPAQGSATPFEQRRATACDQLGPKLTACAVEDAKADFAAGHTTQAQLDQDTAPEIQRKNTADFEKACRDGIRTSRQVRVLEVCFREESQCAQLLSCLEHVNDGAKPAKPAS